MKIPTDSLLTDLVERTKLVLNEVEMLKDLPIEELEGRENADSWSTLECIEHLNLYGDFYLKEIENRISHSKYQPVKTFRSGWIGNYFANSMLPNEKMSKIKTFKDKNPKGNQLDKTAIDRFIAQQYKTLELLSNARKVNLNKTKTAISISSFLKLKLGDTFKVVIYHNQRHIVQIKKILEVVGRRKIIS